MTHIQLLQLRKQFDWTQKEAAQQLGCSVRSIVCWERNERAIPRSIALAASAAIANLKEFGA